MIIETIILNITLKSTNYAYTSYPDFVNFDDTEEATQIKKLILLKVSYFKRIIILPIIMFCTAFLFLLILIWYPGARKRFLY